MIDLYIPILLSTIDLYIYQKFQNINSRCYNILKHFLLSQFTNPQENKHPTQINNSLTNQVILISKIKSF